MKNYCRIFIIYINSHSAASFFWLFFRTMQRLAILHIVCDDAKKIILASSDRTVPILSYILQVKLRDYTKDSKSSLHSIEKYPKNMPHYANSYK